MRIASVARYLMAVFVGCVAVAQANGGDVTVQGITMQIDKNGKYVPLEGVVIQAYRAGPLLKDPVVSGKNGSYSFTVPEGTPFDVAFHGEDRVPELSQLAGADGSVNNVNVALYTREQYRTSAQGERLPLRDKLHCQLRQVPKDSVSARAISALMQKER